MLAGLGPLGLVDSAGHDLIDALWLAPKAAPALTRFVQSPASAQRDRARALSLHLGEQLVARGPSAEPWPQTSATQVLHHPVRRSTVPRRRAGYSGRRRMELVPTLWARPGNGPYAEPPPDDHAP